MGIGVFLKDLLLCLHKFDMFIMLITVFAGFLLRLAAQQWQKDWGGAAGNDPVTGEHLMGLEGARKKFDAMIERVKTQVEACRTAGTP
jgi:hypothetical protein